MTHKEIEEKKQELNKICAMIDEGPSKKPDLIRLAKQVGASISDKYKGYGEATTAQLVDNINDALRTEAMVNSCRTAARNFIIAVIAAIAAVLSALGALILTFK